MSTTPAHRLQLVVGTAGHIDHGKSRLVYALTGVDPDRLPEEKARGMTIDLGFAHTRIDEADVWFVDVPGHERFIRNMVAGATGIDLPLLVVAADDSAMPQTREHAEVLALLGFAHCVVALTKMDLVDDDWADAVEHDVAQVLAAHGLVPLEVIRTSAQTGRGIEDLRRTLARLAANRPPSAQPAYRWFRMPIDRAFTVPGRGTVVTGSVQHGAVCSGDELELWPAGRPVRIRDLQSHHEAAEAAAGRMRLAMNLAGVAVEQAGRGCELASPGRLAASGCLVVHIHALRMPGKTPRRSLRLRLHMATRDVLARVELREPPAGPQVRGVLAQLRPAEPVVAAWGQRFILRDEAATRTLGGGWVLSPVSRPWTRKVPADVEALTALRDAAPKQRLEAAVRLAGWEAPDALRLSAAAGLEDGDVAERLCRELGSDKRLVRLGSGAAERYVHIALLDAASEGVSGRIAGLLERNPRSAGVPRRELGGWMPRSCPEPLRAALAEWMVASGRLTVGAAPTVPAGAGDFVVPAGHASAMSAQDRALLDALLEEFAAGAFRPPAIEELKCRDARNARRCAELVELAAAQGRLVRISDGLWLHADRWSELVTRLTAALRERGEVAVSDVRSLLDSSRKYIVPILEYTDAQGLTRRRGDARVLGPRAEALAEQAPRNP